MKKERIIEILLILASLGLAFLITISGIGRIFNLKVYDMFSTYKPRPPELKDIVYVNIDDPSIDIVGRWPWPRSEIAKGVTILKEFGARRIIFDIEFFEKSQDILNYEVYNEIKEQGNFSISLGEIYKDLIIQPDNAFYKSMSGANVYLACRGVSTTKKERTDIESSTFRELEEIAKRYFIPLYDLSLTNSIVVEKYMESPVYPLWMGAKGIGFTSARDEHNKIDIDGTLRRVQLFRIYNNYLVCQLTVPSIIDDLEIDRKEIRIYPGKYISLKPKNEKEIRIPIDENGNMIINWTKKWTDVPFGGFLPFSALIEYYNHREALKKYESYLTMKGLSEDDYAMLYQYAEIERQILAELSNKISIVKNKVTITGNTSTSSTDLGAITIASSVPLVLLMGNIINTIKTRSFIYELPFVYNLLIVLIISIIIYFLSIKIQSALREVSLLIAILIVIIIGMYCALAFGNLIINYSLTFFGAFFSLFIMTMYKFVQYDQQKNFIKKAFMQYLSPEVVKEVVNNPSLLKLGGERKIITAFFSDVAGFTTISEKLTPEQLVHLLNLYLTAMSDIIMSYGGTVDKYEGDAIVAFFGAPVPHPDHPLRACKAVIDMQKEIKKRQDEWTKMGYPTIKARMGINTGPAIIGNMGSEQRMNYTMMGDTVNLASRLEGANKNYGTYSMMSESTYKEVKDVILARKLDKIRVVGKSEPVSVYEIMELIENADQRLKDLCNKYMEAMRYYEEREFEKAYELFNKCFEEFNDTTSKIYRDRCKSFIENPPPANWDGVFVLKEK